MTRPPRGGLARRAKAFRRRCKSAGGIGGLAGLRLLVEASPDPARAAVLFGVEPGGLPDRHALEMRSVGVGIAHTRHQGELASIEQPSQIAQRGVQADAIVDPDELLLGNAKHLAVLRIAFVANGTSVLIASLPPSSWMTTRTRPSRCGAAARAVCARNVGTVGLKATRAALLSEVRSMSRRVAL